MAKTASLNIRVDPVAKLKAEKIYSSFGITLSDAVNMFIYKSIQCNGLPFELKSNVQITETELNKTPENREEAQIVENISEPIDVKSKIVKLSQEGWTIEEIAHEMKITVSEVEIILELSNL